MPGVDRDKKQQEAIYQHSMAEFLTMRESKLKPDEINTLKEFFQLCENGKVTMKNIEDELDAKKIIDIINRSGVYLDEKGSSYKFDRDTLLVGIRIANNIDPAASHRRSLFHR